MTDLETFLADFPAFDSDGQSTQVTCLAYFLHKWRRQDRFVAADIRGLYADAKCVPPKNIADVIARLCARKSVLKDRQGYYLTAQAERDVALVHPHVAAVRQASIQASTDLRSLLSKVSSSQGADYLAEAITCFEARCFRAAIVMGWAVCYDHLLGYVLRGRLAEFNDDLAKRNQKIRTVRKREDFADLQESLILQICRAAGITDKTTAKTLERSLNTRNDYAHPSGRTVSPATAEAFIEDIVNNAIVKLQ